MALSSQVDELALDLNMDLEFNHIVTLRYSDNLTCFYKFLRFQVLA